jgi:molybdate transport system substrate-binding protein
MRLLATLALALALTSAAHAAEIRVLAATPLTAVVTELGAKFERETGHTLVTRFMSGPVVKREIDGGAPFDVALSITPVVEALVKEGTILPATRTDVAYAGVGVGVRAGAPKPDVGTVDGFRRALLDAKSVAHSAEGASGVYFKELLDRLGIAEAMRGKLKPMPAATIAKAVPSGEAEMIVVTMSVIVGSGAELVGPVPAELQFYNRFAGGVGAAAKDRDAAAALLRYLTAPAAAPVIRAKGMEPGVPR